MMATHQAVPFRGGDLWVAVSAHGRGQPVQITRVNNVSVYFRAFGRGADASQTFKLNHDAFRVRYAPLQQADDRQKRLARADRSTPRMPALGEPSEVAPSPEAVVAEPETEAPAAPERAAPTLRGGKARKLTGDQAREIVLLMQGGAKRPEVAETYGIDNATVGQIMRGQGYRWATADLLAAARSTPPTPTPKEVTPVAPPPPEPVRLLPTATSPDLLSVEAADALDFLLEYAGRPLPKFMMIDLDQIRRVSIALRGQCEP